MKRRPATATPAARRGAPAREPRVGHDAESCLAADLAAQEILDRGEEAALARRITAARRRTRALLRGVRPLVAVALADAGRGVIAPERDFREREAVAVLRFAEAALRTRGGWRATGLTAAKLRQVTAALDASLREYRELRDQMLRANVRLVASLARRHHHPTLTFLDLFQEGTFGLLRAVEKYEPARGVRFSTYAAWWISQQLGRAADTQGALIRTPVHWNQMRRRLGRSDVGASPAEHRSAAASAFGIDEQRFATMTEAWQFVSTDSAAGDDGRPLASMLADPDADPHDAAARRGLEGRLDSIVEQLPERERHIMRRRFGLSGEQQQTLEELSAEMGVSRERIRQLEARGLARLRVACGEQGLRDYLH